MLVIQLHHTERLFNYYKFHEAKNGYKPQAEDTSRETDQLTFRLLRQRSLTDRLVKNDAKAKADD